MQPETILFLIFALASCGGAVAVVLSQNVVRMAFWLILSLGSVSGLFFLLEADFVAATQLLIYVGGTVVLLVFGVMLTASGPYLKIKSSPAETFIAGGVGLLLLSLLLWTVKSAHWPVVSVEQDETVASSEVVGHTTRPLGFALVGLRPDKDLESADAAEALAESLEGDVESEPVDVPLSTGYLLPFEIVSVHLLVVLIGAAYLARAKRRVDSEGAA